MQIRWLGNSCVELISEYHILIDPSFLVEPLKEPDIILITHEHQDHIDPCSINNFSEARIFAPSSVYEEYSLEGKVTEAGTVIDGGIEVLNCSCYNSDESVSYYYGGILHTADASTFPRPSGKINLLFTACFPDLHTEYLESCRELKPDLIIPYHYDPHDHENREEAKALLRKLKENNFNARLLELGEQISIS